MKLTSLIKYDLSQFNFEANDKKEALDKLTTVRVIPPLFVASGIAGALSMMFGVVSKAPHGGIFAVIAKGVTNPVMYLLALLVGTVVGALLLMVSLKTNNKK
ncbi:MULTISPECIES: PTS sugar transporter subunit IIABC [unclassified Gemella]|uniref:PTS sugar transporter subunit IIABC n=1 Tax=unclassified Gemella TaxID=2624949 RepID=UPI001D162899|nr:MULTISPECIES: PTS sugar transporter subunit IIABC [unclassified Gemella]